MLESIVIVPAGGMGLGVAQAIEDINKIQPTFTIVGFLDDNEELWGQMLWEYPILGPITSYSKYIGHGCKLVIAGFANDHDIDRVERTYKLMELPPSKFATIIHPTATVSDHSRIGPGCVIAPGVSIAPEVYLGSNVYVMANSCIEHNSEIGPGCNIATSVSIAGHVSIEKNCWIGANSSITSKINIGSGSVIGIGAVVIRDVEQNTVVVGNPAKFLRKAN